MKATQKIFFTQLQRQVINNCILLVLMDYKVSAVEIVGDDRTLLRYRFALSLAEILTLHNWLLESKEKRGITLGHSKWIDLFLCIQEVNCFLKSEQERFASNEIIMTLFGHIINTTKN